MPRPRRESSGKTNEAKNAPSDVDWRPSSSSSDVDESDNDYDRSKQTKMMARKRAASTTPKKRKPRKSAASTQADDADDPATIDITTTETTTAAAVTTTATAAATATTTIDDDEFQTPDVSESTKKRRRRMRDWETSTIDDAHTPSTLRKTAQGGYSHTNSSKRLISKANTGNTPWNKGKIRSSADRARISAGVRARNRALLLQKLKYLGMAEEEYLAKKREIKYLRERIRRAKTKNRSARGAEEELKQAASSIDTTGFRVDKASLEVEAKRELDIKLRAEDLLPEIKPMQSLVPSQDQIASPVPSLSLQGVAVASPMRSSDRAHADPTNHANDNANDIANDDDDGHDNTGMSGLFQSSAMASPTAARKRGILDEDAEQVLSPTQDMKSPRRRLHAPFQQTADEQDGQVEEQSTNAMESAKDNHEDNHEDAANWTNDDGNYEEDLHGHEHERGDVGNNESVADTTEFFQKEIIFQPHIFDRNKVEASHKQIHTSEVSDDEKQDNGHREDNTHDDAKKSVGGESVFIAHATKTQDSAPTTYASTCPTGGPGGLICCKHCCMQYSSYMMTTVQDMERSRQDAIAQQIQDLMDMANDECERLRNAAKMARRVEPRMRVAQQPTVVQEDATTEGAADVVMNDDDNPVVDDEEGDHEQQQQQQQSAVATSSAQEEADKQDQDQHHDQHHHQEAEREKLEGGHYVGTDYVDHVERVAI